MVRLMWWGLLALVVVIFFLSPIRLPYSLDVFGKLMPVKMWSLVRSRDGSVISSLQNYVHGTTHAFSVREVGRGDNFTFELHPSVVIGSTLAAGDTVGTIHSFELAQRLVQLKGKLAIEQAALNLHSTGEKTSVVRAAQQRLVYAQTQADLQRKKLKRLQALFVKNAVSEVDLEIVEGELSLLEIQIEIEGAKLNAEQTGARDPRVDWAQANVDALRQEIDVLERKLSAATLISPIDGRVAGFFSADTLVVIQDVAEYAVILPIPWQNRDDVVVGQEVVLKGVGGTDAPTGRVAYIDPMVRTVNGLPVFPAIISIDTSIESLTPGVIVECSLVCESLLFWQYAWRFLKE